MQNFFLNQFRRVSAGVVVGFLLGIFVRLLTRDSAFSAAMHAKWASLAFHRQFAGFHEYKSELIGLIVALIALILVPLMLGAWRYARAWWAGIVSAVGVVSAVLTVLVLHYGANWRALVFSLLSFGVLIGLEYWRYGSISLRPLAGDLKLNIPTRKALVATDYHWNASSADDPIQNWEEDIIGRAAVVELLAEHALRLRTPIVALHGGLGDGKSSVLNLLRRAVGRQAIVVSFSAWLPGSEVTLATDLFRDIATECRKYVHVPELRKHALAYARTVSGSVSYLAGLKEILPAQSQREGIDDLREALARVPLPIVVLLDEIDRMQKEEILVLLKILRGVASIPNISFICAFSEEEIRKELSKDSRLSYEYLEKFFPLTINLSAPAPEMLGRLLRDKLTTTFREQKWFSTKESEAKFVKLLDRVWNDSLSRVCTNIRKIGLLFNDIAASARPIIGEVNAFDLCVIEAVRRFYPEIYRIVQKNPLFLTYAISSWTKGRLFAEEEKKRGAGKFFESLNETISVSNDPTTVEAMLSWIFPDYADSRTTGTTIFALSRPTDRDTAETEKRICHPDYFPIYFRAAIPEEMFSNAELDSLLAAVAAGTTESSVESAFGSVLDAIPPSHPKRDDFLWKLGGVLDRVSDIKAEWLAYASAYRAADYAYDVMNIGEASRALNIVFAAAQKLSGSSGAQRTLVGAMAKATDDTFAVRLLEFTENRDRNKILTDFSKIRVEDVRKAFLERMRQRYGPTADPDNVDISHGDWRALRVWVDSSPEDAAIEQNFWCRFVASRKRLAKAITLVYPGGNAVWDADPRPIIDKLFPLKEADRLLRELPDEQLDEVEKKELSRLEALLQGEYPRAGQWPESS